MNTIYAVKVGDATVATFRTEDEALMFKDHITNKCNFFEDEEIEIGKIPLYVDAKHAIEKHDATVKLARIFEQMDKG